MPRQSDSLSLIAPTVRNALLTRRQTHAGRLTLLSLALASALSSQAALADCAAGGTITTNVSGTQNWGAADCTITSSGNIS